jgi:hypothetical protein
MVFSGLERAMRMGCHRSLPLLGVAAVLFIAARDWAMFLFGGIATFVARAARICDFSAAFIPSPALNVVHLQSGLSIHGRSRC